MTKYELDESKRNTKWGRHGIHKYVYQDEQQEDINGTITGYIKKYFPEASIDYLPNYQMYVFSRGVNTIPKRFKERYIQ